MTNENSNQIKNKKKDERKPSKIGEDNLINRGEDYMKRAVNKKLANIIKNSNHDAKSNTSLR